MVQHHKNTPTITHVTCLSHSPFLTAHEKFKSNPICRVGFLSSDQRDSAFRFVGLSSDVFTSYYCEEVVAWLTGPSSVFFHLASLSPLKQFPVVLLTCTFSKWIKQQRKKGFTPIESCTCLDVSFFFYIYFPALRMLLSLCWCHQLEGQHMKKETEMELGPFSMHPGWRIPHTAWGLPTSIANGKMWIKWIFGDEQHNDWTTAFIPYKQKYFGVTGPLKAYCLYVKDQK